VAKIGAGSATSFTSFRGFWAVAARKNSSLAPHPGGMPTASLAPQSRPQPAAPAGPSAAARLGPPQRLGGVLGRLVRASAPHPLGSLHRQLCLQNVSFLPPVAFSHRSGHAVRRVFCEARQNIHIVDSDNAER
jgi:hypothetical protein